MHRKCIMPLSIIFLIYIIPRYLNKLCVKKLLSMDSYFDYA